MSIHFKFKSSKDYDTFTFPGSVIRLIDLKKAIVEKKKLAKGLDFDLVITDAQNGTVYTDDNQQIPKNTSVTVKRIPAKGDGILARLQAEAAEKAAVSAAINPVISNGLSISAAVAPTQQSDENNSTTKKDSLEDELEALKSQTDGLLSREQRLGNKTWTAGSGSNSDKVLNYYAGANGQSAGRGGGRGGQTFGAGRGNPANFAHLQNTEPPPNYVCYRCGKSGHYIQFCPTNGDPQYERHRVKKKTGIPKSFMKAVEDPEDIKDASGTIVNAPWGGFAVVETQNQNFSELLAKSGGSSTLDKVRLNPPKHLGCPICKRLFSDAVLIPCCQESACDECLRTALIDNKMQCPLCKEHNMTPEKLLQNKVLRASVDEFLRRSVTEKKERDKLVKKVEEETIAKQKALGSQKADKIAADAVLEIKNDEGEILDDDFGANIFDMEDKEVEKKDVEKESAVSVDTSKDIVPIQATINTEIDAKDTTPTDGKDRTQEDDPKFAATPVLVGKNNQGILEHPQGPPSIGMGFHPDPWYRGPPPPPVPHAPWFNGPPPPWGYDPSFGSRGPPPRPVGRTHPPPRGYYGPPTDYFGPPMPWFDGGFGPRGPPPRDWFYDENHREIIKKDDEMVERKKDERNQDKTTGDKDLNKKRDRSENSCRRGSRSPSSKKRRDRSRSRSSDRSRRRARRSKSPIRLRPPSPFLNRRGSKVRDRDRTRDRDGGKSRRSRSPRSGKDRKEEQKENDERRVKRSDNDVGSKNAEKSRRSSKSDGEKKKDKNEEHDTENRRIDKKASTSSGRASLKVKKPQEIPLKDQKLKKIKSVESLTTPASSTGRQTPKDACLDDVSAPAIPLDFLQNDGIKADDSGSVDKKKQKKDKKEDRKEVDREKERPKRRREKDHEKDSSSHRRDREEEQSKSHRGRSRKDSAADESSRSKGRKSSSSTTHVDKEKSVLDRLGPRVKK